MPSTTADDIFKSLNKAQRRAVSSEAPTVAILAGPGSGKTHTLTSRVVWLIDHVGFKPCDVMVATFTVKASNEMKTRIGHALGGGREKKIILGTFHSIARRYLAAYGKLIGLDPKFGIADDSDSRGVINRICKRLGAPIEPPVARAWISKRKAKGTSDEQVVKAKNGQAVESKALEQCFREYQDHLERSNLLDYDDLLVRCVELLRKFPHCVSNIQTVLIDEYQDTNGVQYDLMKLFAQKNRRITIVGDPDQSIYGWRSAEIRNLHRLLRDFPGTDEISLEENYRSSSSILAASLNVIQQDEDRYKKALLPVHDKGSRPVLRKLKTPTQEAEWIVSEIKRIRLLSGNMINFDDVAILLRSASLSRHIESVLGREGISYRMVGGFKFYERAEIKIVLDYMRIIHQPHNNDALARIINVPKRGVGETTIKSLLEEAERGSMSLWDLLDKHCRGDRIAKTALRKNIEQKISGELIRLIGSLRRKLRPSDGTPINLVDIIQQLLRDLQFEKYLEDTYGPEYESRWANIQEFVNLAEEFMRQGQLEEEPLPAVDRLEQAPDNDVLAKFLANVTLASDKQTEDKDQEGKRLVTVSTIHAAKGLEWPVVFVPAVYKGSIPHVRSDDDNEERRLLYVAMTRAKVLLYLSCPLYTGNNGGSGGAVSLSPFVEDLTSSFLQRGPSFDRPVMSQVARILRRTLPPDDVIYKGMPVMTAPEDNLFPIDPNQPQQPATIESDRYGQNVGPRKRQKLQSGQKAVQVAEESVEGWAAPYATTMDKAGSFTIPSGFTTAGAHLATVTAAAAAATAEAKSAPKHHSAGNTRRPPPTRPPGQRNLLGYGYGVTNHDKSKQRADEPMPSSSRSSSILASAPPYARPSSLHPHRRRPNYPTPTTTTSSSLLTPTAPQPAIAPALAAHKLGPARLPSKPVTTTSNSHYHGQDEAGTAAATPQMQKQKQKQYACFSSSPPQPASPEKRTGEPGSPPPEDHTRPAASFHATTVGWRGGGGGGGGGGGLSLGSGLGLGLGGGGGGGGIKRLAGLGRNGIAPPARLNKPYKLTVKRP
ncbi:P-loop containing nucleoside triphosphate hydrolase protein [Biscogniauxia mediterranea]|nr:P-loop containing nucleoside triphosphate hydrolase protein [Biscogniauxia mediterranea]